MRRSVRRGALVLALLGLAACAPHDPAPAPELALLAELEPWPWVSRLIGYRGRVWFLHSRGTGEQHSTADLHSYDPATGATRYERHLFSQNAGWPAEVGGLLYWPHEDSRFHVGVGHLTVTDGQAFALRTIPEPRLEHVHALGAWRGRLVASGSTLRPRVVASEDGGRTWDVVYAAPVRERRVARILRLASLGDRLFGTWMDGAQIAVERTLVEITEGGVRAVPGWPRGREVIGLATLGGWLHGVVRDGEVRELWRTDGERSERLGAGPPRGLLRDLAGGGGALFALALESEGAGVWRSEDGVGWSPVARVPGLAQDLEVVGGRPYVGGTSARGRGALWGPAPGVAIEGGAPPLTVPLEASTPSRRDDVDWAFEGRALAEALADPASYDDALAPLVARVGRLARVGPPPGLFEALLEGPFAAGRVAILDGLEPTPRRQAGPWVLLWGLAVAGRGTVPTRLLGAPLEGPFPREKTFEAPVAALAALPFVDPPGADAVEALIERLEAGADPPFVRGDVVGALSAVTGERHGDDAAAWRAWWSRRAPGAVAPD